MILIVKVKPGAKSNLILIDDQGNFILKIKAPPVDGKANEEIIKFLSAILQVPKSRISILKGHTTAFKKINIDDISEAEVIKLVQKESGIKNSKLFKESY